MSGIRGRVNFIESDAVDPMVITRMTEALAHREPDDTGDLVNGSMGLGHRRHSLIDSSDGRQPTEAPRLAAQPKLGALSRSVETWAQSEIEFWRRLFVDSHARLASKETRRPILAARQIDCEEPAC